MFLPYFCTPFKKGIVELVAQLVEQYTFNVWALGSSPSGITKPLQFGGVFYFVSVCLLHISFFPTISTNSMLDLVRILKEDSMNTIWVIQDLLNQICHGY